MGLFEDFGRGCALCAWCFAGVFAILGFVGLGMWLNTSGTTTTVSTPVAFFIKDTFLIAPADYYQVQVDVIFTRLSPEMCTVYSPEYSNIQEAELAMNSYPVNKTIIGYYYYTSSTQCSLNPITVTSGSRSTSSGWFVMMVIFFVFTFIMIIVGTILTCDCQ